MAKKGIIKYQDVTADKVDMSRAMRKALTPAEAMFWEMVRDRRMHDLKFRRQQVIDGYIVDFYCDSLGLCVEIDGDVHETPEQIEHDRLRDEVLRERGLKIVRFGNEEVLGKKEYVRKRLKDLIPQ